MKCYADFSGKGSALANLGEQNRPTEDFVVLHGSLAGRPSRKAQALQVLARCRSLAPTTLRLLSPCLANGRYAVMHFLSEGDKVRVCLAHDTLLDGDVARALSRTEGLDETGRDRIKRESQAICRLGAHPHIVLVFDVGEER
jgi:hypothetical protein